MVSGGRLLRALRRSAVEHGCAPALASIRETPWTSATFAGAQYAITASAPHSPEFDRWLSALPGLDLAMPGQFADDIVATSRMDEAGLSVAWIEALVIAG